MPALKVDSAARSLTTCEHENIDLSVIPEPSAGGTRVALEFKAIHNNKNFRSKLWEIRRDVGRHPPEIVRCGLLIDTYVVFRRDDRGNYQHLSGGRRGVPATLQEFEQRLKKGLASEEDGYGEKRLAIVKQEIVAPLDGAPYVEPRHGSRVSLALLGPAREA